MKAREEYHLDTNELNRVMGLSPEELIGRPQDIDTIIAINRKWQAAYDGGAKITQDQPKMDLSKFTKADGTPLVKTSPIKRRMGL